jgi:hypothetical protein
MGQVRAEEGGMGGGIVSAHDAANIESAALSLKMKLLAVLAKG